MLGERHPDTATSLNNLAALLACAGGLRRRQAPLRAGPGDPQGGAGRAPPRHRHQPEQPGGAARGAGGLRRRQAPPRAGGGHQPAQPRPGRRRPDRTTATGHGRHAPFQSRCLPLGRAAGGDRRRGELSPGPGLEGGHPGAAAAAPRPPPAPARRPPARGRPRRRRVAVRRRPARHLGPGPPGPNQQDAWRRQLADADRAQGPARGGADAARAPRSAPRGPRPSAPPSNSRPPCPATPR